jgi:hypothetical protein
LLFNASLIYRGRAPNEGDVAICPLTSLGHASTLSPVSYIVDNFEASKRNSKFGIASIKLNPEGASEKSPNDIVPVCS